MTIEVFESPRRITLVKAWNGKVHIFEKRAGTSPAVPIGPYNSVAKPERDVALTGCGNRVMIKKMITAHLATTPRWKIIRDDEDKAIGAICTHCSPVIMSRLGG